MFFTVCFNAIFVKIVENFSQGNDIQIDSRFAQQIAVNVKYVQTALIDFVGDILVITIKL